MNHADAVLLMNQPCVLNHICHLASAVRELSGGKVDSEIELWIHPHLLMAAINAKNTSTSNIAKVGEDDLDAFMSVYGISVVPCEQNDGGALIRKKFLTPEDGTDPIKIIGWFHARHVMRLIEGSTDTLAELMEVIE